MTAKKKVSKRNKKANKLFFFCFFFQLYLRTINTNTCTCTIYKYFPGPQAVHNDCEGKSIAVPQSVHFATPVPLLNVPLLVDKKSTTTTKEKKMR